MSVSQEKLREDFLLPKIKAEELQTLREPGLHPSLCSGKLRAARRRNLLTATQPMQGGGLESRRQSQLKTSDVTGAWGCPQPGGHNLFHFVERHALDWNPQIPISSSPVPLSATTLPGCCHQYPTFWMRNQCSEDLGAWGMVPSVSLYAWQVPGWERR